ncbi:MAG: alpha-galactosidase [Actinomycetota bacterium]
MKRLGLLLAALLVVAGVPAVRAGSGPGEMTLSNGLVRWTWSRAPFRTTSIVDLRDGVQVAGESSDFALTLAGVDVSSDQFTVTSVDEQAIAGGRRLTFALAGPGGINATRTVDAFDGVAGFRSRTVLRPTALLALSATALQLADIGTVAPTIHAFRAGADWREPDWPGPQVQVGDPHAGDWRDTHTAGPGQALSAPGEWLSTGRLFLVAERNDLPSSRAAYDGSVASVRADYGRDVISLGPFEENAHVENPAGQGRVRTIGPGGTLALEPVFVGVARDGDDEAWQFHKYLVDHRLAPYAKDVTFNSNGTDDNRISTGAKDDMDLATVEQVAPTARRLGIDTFILDDGWQNISGDWQPDPRRGFDADFANVRAAIAPMKLGLWMSPMHFHPTSQTYQAHPEWVCAPAGHGLAVYNTVDQTSGSNEAGIGEWGPAYIPFLEGRIRTAIEQWHVAYFKFDFLAWLDCAGQDDLYGYHDAFVAMLDRLRADHPEVTFQIDETNDYRLFPFESVSRGPSWFQNGTPTVDQLLHNLWSLSPYIPSWSLGQHFLGGAAWRAQPVETLMAAALLSHLTFFSDLRTIPPEVVDAAAPWLAFYRAHRDELTAGVVYPLLADPLTKDWTALQSWDPEAGRGALLVFRQDGSADTTSVALRNVAGDGTFDLRRAPTGEVIGTASAAELRAGLPVSLPLHGAQVLLITPTPT